MTTSDPVLEKHTTIPGTVDADEETKRHAGEVGQICEAVAPGRLPLMLQMNQQ
jgi:hypothetical protein